MRYLFKAFVRLLITIWFAFTLTFVLLRMVPTNALMARLSQTDASNEQTTQEIQRHGLDRSLPEQYANTILGLLSGNWGLSLVNDQPVILIIRPRLLNTLEWVGAAALVSLLGGVGAGIWAVNHTSGRWMVGLLSSLSLSMPVYWTATLVLFTVAYWLNIGQRSMLLAVGVLAFHLGSVLARFTQHILSDATTDHFVRYARSKGLSESAIWWRHRLPYAAAPLIAVFTAQISLTLGSTVALESVFGQPGLGSTLLAAVIQRDYPVAQAVIVILAISVTLLTSLSELINSWFDPRLRLHR